MITFAGKKVTANEKAKLELWDTLRWKDLDLEDSQLTDKEKEEIQKQYYKKLDTVYRSLGIEQLSKKLDLWQD